MNGKDAMNWAKQALASAAAPQPVKVIEAHWVPERKEWEVEARGVTDDGRETGSWSTFTGDQLADLLSLARDVATGG